MSVSMQPLYIARLLLTALSIRLGARVLWAWAQSGRVFKSAVVTLGVTGASFLLVIVATDRVCEGMAHDFDVRLQNLPFRTLAGNATPNLPSRGWCTHG